jgi:hypothetical protein
MDSKTVNKEIRALIWPALKAAGFSSFSARTAWRYEKDQVEVVNFQSFNRHNADVLDVTTFSFAVNLGSYLCYVPPQWPRRSKQDVRYRLKVSVISAVGLRALFRRNPTSIPIFG